MEEDSDSFSVKSKMQMNVFSLLHKQVTLKITYKRLFKVK